jgi:hypothetical protein
MPFLDNFLNEVKDDIFELAKEKLGGRVKEAKEDTRVFLEKTEKDFNRWLKLKESGDLTQGDFEWLAIGKKDLLELYALKHAGLSLLEAEQFKVDLLVLIIKGAFNLIKIA